MRTIRLRHLGSAANGLAGGGIPVIRAADQRYAAELRCGRDAIDAAGPL